jgi:LAO/AO transport system kinase
MYETINETLKSSFYLNPTIEPLIAEMEARVLEEKTSSFTAAHELLDRYFSIK